MILFENDGLLEADALKKVGTAPYMSSVGDGLGEGEPMWGGRYASEALRKGEHVAESDDDDEGDASPYSALCGLL